MKDIENMTDEQFMERVEKIREDKNCKAKKVISGRRHFIKAVNFLLLTAYYQQSPHDLTDMIVGMKIFLERFGLQDDCFILVDQSLMRPYFVLVEDVADY